MDLTNDRFYIRLWASDTPTWREVTRGEYANAERLANLSQLYHYPAYKSFNNKFLEGKVQ